MLGFIRTLNSVQSQITVYERCLYYTKTFLGGVSAGGIKHQDYDFAIIDRRIHRTLGQLEATMINGPLRISTISGPDRMNIRIASSADLEPGNTVVFDRSSSFSGGLGVDTLELMLNGSTFNHISRLSSVETFV